MVIPKIEVGRNMEKALDQRNGIRLPVARGSNVLLLDEPINHLDIPSRERFERALVGFEGTVLAVAHDRYFLDRVVNQIWAMESTGVKSYKGNYSTYVQQREIEWQHEDTVFTNEF